MTDAVVVGSGPNGLTAGVLLAQAGVRVTVLEAAPTIGGGTRTVEMTLPGLLHDHCSAVHPLGVGSPVLQSLHLEEHGLEWLWPEVDLAHPLDDGRAAVLVKDLDETVRGLGADGPAWRKLFAPLTDSFATLAPEVLQPLLHVPRHPLLLAAFGARALLPADVLARLWDHEEARALFAGGAAHAYRPLSSLASSAAGLMLLAAGHAYGWPVAKGGSARITDALASKLTQLGGRIETGHEVTELPDADLVLLDTSPSAALRIVGDRLPARVRWAYRRYAYGPAAFKVDLAVEGGVPWTHEAVRRAGTVHVAGTFEEVAQAEKDVSRGRMPERPFVLLAQQSVADPSRAKDGVHPVWAYAHVPNGYTGDATEALLAQVERFAPGFRERVVATVVNAPRALEQDNANYVGGDIATGRNDVLQLVMRPRPALDPYSTGVEGVYLCSAATPPGAGVHGMAGAGAARSALKHLGR